MADGSPAFPDKVISIWACDGFLVGDGMRTETGTIVIARQIIQFTEGDLLITHGSELADVDVSVTRAVTGGTRDYTDAPAKIRQVMLGMSNGDGVRLQIELGEQQKGATAAMNGDRSRKPDLSHAAPIGKFPPLTQGTEIRVP